MSLGNIKRWLYDKGLAGAISTDLVIKYLALKRNYPNEKDTDTLKRVWNDWLTLNEQPIREENGENKIVRLEIIKERRSGVSEFDRLGLEDDTLLFLYLDILYIETEILSEDGKIFNDATQVFVKKAKQYGLDFTKEYENQKRILKHLGRI